MTKQIQTQEQIDAKAAKAAKATATKAAKVAKATASGSAFYSALMVAILAGKMGAKCQAYYTRANSYHLKQGTIFPRDKTAAQRASMTKELAQEIIGHAQAGTLAPAQPAGQALYDLMKSA
jgi:hypothetical protein